MFSQLKYTVYLKSEVCLLLLGALLAAVLLAGCEATQPTPEPAPVPTRVNTLADLGLTSEDLIGRLEALAENGEFPAAAAQEEGDGDRPNACTSKQIEGGYEDVDGECVLTGWNWVFDGRLLGNDWGGCKTATCSGGGSGGGSGTGTGNGNGSGDGDGGGLPPESDECVGSITCTFRPCTEEEAYHIYLYSIAIPDDGDYLDAYDGTFAECIQKTSETDLIQCRMAELAMGCYAACEQRIRDGCAWNTSPLNPN